MINNENTSTKNQGTQKVSSRKKQSIIAGAIGSGQEIETIRLSANLSEGSYKTQALTQEDDQ